MPGFSACYGNMAYLYLGTKLIGNHHGYPKGHRQDLNKSFKYPAATTTHFSASDHHLMHRLDRLFYRPHAPTRGGEGSSRWPPKSGVRMKTGEGSAEQPVVSSIRGRLWSALQSAH
jgi:hypothetical protein